jgi:hypothetical protein
MSVEELTHCSRRGVSKEIGGMIFGKELTFITKVKLAGLASWADADFCHLVLVDRCVASGGDGRRSGGRWISNDCFEGALGILEQSLVRRVFPFGVVVKTCPHVLLRSGHLDHVEAMDHVNDKRCEKREGWREIRCGGSGRKIHLAQLGRR